MSKYDSHNLWAWVLQVYTAMDRARKQELFKYNINRSQGSVLSIISTLGNDATLNQISQMLFRRINTVSETLSRMEKQGLVKRVKDLKQKNRIRITLTEKGIIASHQASKRENIERIMSCLTKEERHQLRSCCQKLYYKALEELGMQPDKNWPL
jgi:DNA-binding MarR family transcriptional regulator